MTTDIWCDYCGYYLAKQIIFIFIIIIIITHFNILLNSIVFRWNSAKHMHSGKTSNTVM